MGVLALEYSSTSPSPYSFTNTVSPTRSRGSSSKRPSAVATSATLSLKPLGNLFQKNPLALAHPVIFAWEARVTAAEAETGRTGVDIACAKQRVPLGPPILRHDTIYLHTKQRVRLVRPQPWIQAARALSLPPSLPPSLRGAPSPPPSALSRCSCFGLCLVTSVTLPPGGTTKGAPVSQSLESELFLSHSQNGAPLVGNRSDR